ncbi:p-aminobenzoyl-glutamate transport protein [BD1-7 clade bacterium]|uniref:p-aminobenzoyl-glutamate transport protein n=1 Tax=BD1-7 clade bacterium TaxID=2029982 RepID=A0A5S9NS99_9GAMM|nr:p-aminobenzoyl-glutamate transport protein [BD1-7 clade bacterium]CAA0093486.1 p-aminobenzoyl-glutamate transport protein [BD1-7 clade bacterium]
MNALLESIERIGNRIPHPSLMFFWLCISIVVLSAITALANVSAINPVDQSVIAARSLASAAGLRFILTDMVTNFTSFAPLGIVLVAMLGIGIAEKSGLLNHTLTTVTRYAKGKWLTAVVAFAGVMSSMAADAGYVILVPVAALLYQAAGRSAIEGIATAFAGVSGGFSANLLIGPIDAVLAGISTESAQLVTQGTTILPTSNWLFGIASTVFITVIITVVTEKRNWRHLAAGEITLDTAPASFVPETGHMPTQSPSSTSTQGNLKGIGLFTVIFAGLVALAVVPESAPLRDPITGSIAKSPFISGIVIIIALYFAGVGMIYGKVNGTFKNTRDIILAMEATMSTMAGYLVLMFFAAQFVAYFNWSNIGLIIAIEGANWLTNIDIAKPVLLALFIIISAFINLFVGSSSAKWALIAPIFVPLLMFLGVAPEVTQQAYRIGDSSTNIITPMMPYFALVLSFLQRHNPNAGVGSLMAAMVPYSVSFIIGWSLLFLIWISIGLPLGI